VLGTGLPGSGWQRCTLAFVLQWCTLPHTVAAPMEGGHLTHTPCAVYPAARGSPRCCTPLHRSPSPHLRIAAGVGSAAAAPPQPQACCLQVAVKRQGRQRASRRCGKGLLLLLEHAAHGVLPDVLQLEHAQRLLQELSRAQLDAQHDLRSWVVCVCVWDVRAEGIWPGLRGSTVSRCRACVEGMQQCMRACMHARMLAGGGLRGRGDKLAQAGPRRPQRCKCMGAALPDAVAMRGAHAVIAQRACVRAFVPRAGATPARGKYLDPFPPGHARKPRST